MSKVRFGCSRPCPEEFWNFWGWRFTTHWNLLQCFPTIAVYWGLGFSLFVFTSMQSDTSFLWQSPPPLLPPVVEDCSESLPCLFAYISSLSKPSLSMPFICSTSQKFHGNSTKTFSRFSKLFVLQSRNCTQYSHQCQLKQDNHIPWYFDQTCK